MTPTCRKDVYKRQLLYSSVQLFLGTPFPIILAILFNELKQQRFKKIVQTVSYLPYFLSWISVIGMFYAFFAVDGTFNDFMVRILSLIHIFFASANIETAYSVEGLEKWERSFYLHEDRAQVVIKEDFAIAKNARLEFVFMSAAQPEKTEDGILVNGAKLRCLRRDVSLETERIDLTDDLLQQSWGDRVYRTRFILDIAAGNDSVEFVIE